MLGVEGKSVDPDPPAAGSLGGAEQPKRIATKIRANPQFGLQLYPIERRADGFNVYISAHGTIGYNYLSLNKSATFSSIPNSDQAFSVGYGAAAGVEWIVSDDGIQRWGFFGEISLSKQNAKLLKQNFDLSGLLLSVGLVW